MENLSSTISAVLQSEFARRGSVALDPAYGHALDACVDCVKLISPQGDLLYMNKAGCLALGVRPDGGFGMPWVPLLSPDIHGKAYRAIEQAREGAPGHFLGISGSEGDQTYWDNLLTPITDASARVLAILCVSRNITEQTRLQEQLSAAVERERVLVQEMRHRVKNLFTLVSGLISMAERHASADENVPTFAGQLRNMVQSLARASDATFSTTKEANGEETAGDLETIARAVLAPYAAHVECSGPQAKICSKNMTTLALVLHELATNSMKYGAIYAAGRVRVTWTIEDGAAHILWDEVAEGLQLSPAPSSGFGTKVIDRSLLSIGGAIERSWKDNGARFMIRFPVV